MKKISEVSLASFLFLFLCSSVAILIRPLVDTAWVALLIGILILILSAVLAIFGKGRTPLNIFCFFLSSVALGVLIRAWYLVRGLDNSLGVMTFVSLGAVVYLWVLFALSRIPFAKKRPSVLFAICALYVIATIVLYIIAIVKTKTTYLSTFGFYMIIELAFAFAMSLEVNDYRELIRNLTLSTYSVFGVAIIVAIFVVVALLGGDCDCDCDCGNGECLDCCDCSCSDTPPKNRKKRKTPKM